MALRSGLNPFSASRAWNPRCRVPRHLEAITQRGAETDPEAHGLKAADIEALWGHVEDIYRTGMHPALQICVRHEKEIVLHRALGYASGSGPDESPASPLRPIQLDTPINIFSASKAVTAMLVHKLAWDGTLHLDDRVSDYLPAFAKHGKARVTLRHLLGHRAGLPSLPAKAWDLELMGDLHSIVEVLCDEKLRSRPGRVLSYHAITGGFVLGAVVEAVTGQSLREVLREEIAEPLGLQWLNYGVAAEHVNDVAINATTGPTPPPPLGSILKRALGASIKECVDLSNDPRFLEGIIPSANIISTAEEISLFFQCLLDGGMHEGEEIFDPRCIRHAVAEQSWREIDFTFFAPIRYGLGFMLGSKGIGLFGSDTEQAFGHIGLSNIFCWADPERRLSVAFLNTGKPTAAAHTLSLMRLVQGIGSTFKKSHD